MFKVLESYYGCPTVDVDVYSDEKRAVVYFVESSHMVEIYKVEKGFYCSLMTELEERVIYKKLVRNENHLMDLLDWYEDLCVCGKAA